MSSTRRFIAHPDSLTSTLNVDQIWMTLVKEIERVQRETMQKPDRKTLLSNYVGLGGTLMMSRLVSSFSELGPPHDTIGRSTLSFTLGNANIYQMVRTLYRALQASDWRPQTGSKVSFLETPVGISTVILLYLIESESEIELETSSRNGGNASGGQDSRRRNVKSWEVCAEVIQGGVEVVASELAANQRGGNDDDGCEVLYGRAGLLYALLRLRASVYRCVPRPHDRTSTAAGDDDGDRDWEERSKRLWHLISDEVLVIVINSIIERGRVGARYLDDEASGDTNDGGSTLPPLMWSWHEKRYLGGAHGVAGILQILLMCPTQLISPYIGEILGTIEWLIKLQDQDGNWPSSLRPVDDSRENELVQWCHGAPGLLILFSTLIRRCHTHPTLFRLTPQFASSLISALHKAQVLVYTRGFLRKGVGLCHGVAGSVYALLAASDAMALLRPSNSNSNSPSPSPNTASTPAAAATTSFPNTQQQHQRILQINQHDQFSRAYFLHAVHLAYLATNFRELETQRELVTPDRPWSLYEGDAGMCCAWAEVYDRLGTTGRNLGQDGSGGGEDGGRKDGDGDSVMRDGDAEEVSGGGGGGTGAGTRLHWARSRSGMPGFDDMIVD
ncbi:hypothetical protein K435DRAFT_811880 [Dendrothele bispora CBS 962.96]|uniref:Lanthionine synthetase C-like protein n=1 Tax=Dendrothele bispora (strain CBS 962.96) TaxID=1314807 RepID=A0A4S8KR00_DENBC|nr:hypothetical protein K435DRAFT_811880 [Dendrothele bispora CBS 962.96]